MIILAAALAVLLGAEAGQAEAAPAEPPPAASKSPADILYEDGHALLVAQDFKGARQKFEQAARQDHPGALNALAVLYANGAGGPRGEAKARGFLERAVALGDPAAMANLGDWLLQGEDEAQHARGVELLRRAYKEAVVAALAARSLGRAKLFGLGTARDVEGGVALLRQAEAAGLADSPTLFLLGRAYQNGWGGVEPDAAKSLAYFSRAADQGNGAAAWYAGMYYLNGDGGMRDIPRAAAYVRQAAEAGEVRGQISMAVMLAIGEGIPEDDAQARDWYARAAAQRSAHALRGLGSMLLTGEGGPQDLERGLAYLELAAKGGDGDAEVIVAEAAFKPDAAERRRVDAIKADWVKKNGEPLGDDAF